MTHNKMLLRDALHADHRYNRNNSRNYLTLIHCVAAHLSAFHIEMESAVATHVTISDHVGSFYVVDRSTFVDIPYKLHDEDVILSSRCFPLKTLTILELLESSKIEFQELGNTMQSFDARISFGPEHTIDLPFSGSSAFHVNPVLDRLIEAVRS